MKYAIVSLTLAACAVPAPLEEKAELATATSALFTGNGNVSRTATVYENQATFNGGIYSDVCIGNLAATTATRRAYIAYSLPAIPATATVTRVQLTIAEIAVRNMGGPLAATLALRRVTSAWTEGAGGANTRSCGGGTAAAGITWNTAPSVAGVDSATAPLSSTVGTSVTIDTNVGTANDGLINDVQGWVNGGANDGWRLLVVEEPTANNARALDAGTLTISWTLASGSTCTQDNDCSSGSCVHSDGLDCGGRAGCVCCNAATCSGVCQTCFRAGAVGTCSPRPAGTSCRNASCAGGIATPAANCDGVAQTCPPPTQQDCSPYTCSGTACATSCQMTSACDPNYFCNGSMVCEAIMDECAQNLDDCVPVATCSDPTVAVGDFTCTCPAGFTGNGHGGSGTGCTDVDECAANLDNCDVNATCTNTPGSFTCACNAPGWTGNGQICADVDECAANLDNCDVNATCTNTPGSFTCACNAPGWTGNGQICTDVDECAANLDNCDVNATCTNTPGSFTCACNAPGWTGNGQICTDVDECAANLDNCDVNATCTNTSPGFGCACNAPYWSGDGHNCTDVDECANGNGGCGNDEVCVNQVGGPNTCKPADPDASSGGGCCQSNREPSLPTWVLIGALFWLRTRRRRRGSRAAAHREARAVARAVVTDAQRRA